MHADEERRALRHSRMIYGARADPVQMHQIGSERPKNVSRTALSFEEGRAVSTHQRFPEAKAVDRNALPFFPVR